MKKLFFVFSVVALLAAGCDSAQQAAVQTPAPTPSTQNQTVISSNQPAQQAATTTKAAGNQSVKTTATTESATTTSTQVESSPTAVVKSPSQSPAQTKLKITASAQWRSVSFTSEENYTNCNDSLTVITVDQNQQPVFATYKDNYGSINLFAGDQHSVGYASLTDSVGDTLSGDIVSGEFGNNAAGIWNLTCDQGEYESKINTIQ